MRPNKPAQAEGRNWFEIDAAEFHRARMGFQLENGIIPDVADRTSGTEVATQLVVVAVVAGNLALLKHLPETSPSEDIAELRGATLETINSGIQLGGLAASTELVSS
jgi:hypothetical protein